jgi:NAD(P)-dependent dehydrogenase (short-subunit alcohol dehydrogenase family)
VTRVAVVTGAAGGVGRATVELFHRHDWMVVAIDRWTAPDIAGADRFVRADVGGEDTNAISAALRDLQHVDALVNNAAVRLTGSVAATTPDDWDTVMASNVRGAYVMTRLLHPLMRGRDAAIVNVGSVHAIATTRGSAAYAASKGALVALTRATALDLAPDSMRVNAVLPGAIDTAMLREGMAGVEVDTGIRSLSDRTPLGRIGRPDEIAQAILFLADHERSSFITGQTLVADGGALARLSTE